jgi:hypothetical protein
MAELMYLYHVHVPISILTLNEQIMDAEQTRECMLNKCWKKGECMLNQRRLGAEKMLNAC